jgi:hypothetical protein
MVLPFNRHSLELLIIKPAWSRVAEGTVCPFVVGCPPAHVTRMPFACPVQVLEKLPVALSDIRDEHYHHSRWWKCPEKKFCLRENPGRIRFPPVS